MGVERWPGIDCLRMRDHSQKNLGIRLHLEIVGKIDTYTSDIFLYHQKIQPFASRITFNLRVYKAKDTFLRLLTSFGKSVWYEVLSFACLTVNKAIWVQGGGSYIVILLVLPLGLLTIAKFNGLSMHCFVVAHFFSFVRIPLSNILSVYLIYCT